MKIKDDPIADRRPAFFVARRFTTHRSPAELWRTLPLPSPPPPGLPPPPPALSPPPASPPRPPLAPPPLDDSPYHWHSFDALTLYWQTRDGGGQLDAGGSRDILTSSDIARMHAFEAAVLRLPGAADYCERAGGAMGAKCAGFSGLTSILPGDEESVPRYLDLSIAIPTALTAAARAALGVLAASLNASQLQAAAASALASVNASDVPALLAALNDSALAAPVLVPLATALNLTTDQLLSANASTLLQTVSDVGSDEGTLAGAILRGAEAAGIDTSPVLTALGGENATAEALTEWLGALANVSASGALRSFNLTTGEAARLALTAAPSASVASVIAPALLGVAADSPAALNATAVALASALAEAGVVCEEPAMAVVNRSVGVLSCEPISLLDEGLLSGVDALSDGPTSALSSLSDHGLRNLTCTTAIVVALGVGELQLEASRCGPVVRCCDQCTDSQVSSESAGGSCARELPLCTESSSGASLHFRVPSRGGENGSVAGLSAISRALLHREQLAAEVACPSAPLSTLRSAFPLGYGEDGSSNLSATRSSAAFGTYQGDSARRSPQLSSEYWRWRRYEAMPAYHSWLKTVLMPAVERFNRENDDLDVAAWAGGVLISWELEQGVLNAAKLSLIGVVVMLLYITLHLASPLLACAGLGGVVLSFPVTWFVYVQLFGIAYMGLLNFLALFVIIGIGVDDIFVFIDAWKQSALHHSSLMERMDYAYRRSMYAMAITSLTDACAFYANCLSQITIVRLFGVFMGTIVLVNFLLVLTAFPALVVLRFRLGLEAPGRWLPSWREHRTFDPHRRMAVDGASFSSRAEGESASKRKGPRRAAWTQGIARVLEHWYLPALYRGRWVVLLLTVGVAGGAAWLVTQLQPTSKTFQAETFRAHSNVMRVVNTIDDFSLVGSSTRVDISWGITGIDRTGEDPNDPLALGKPTFESPSTWSPGTAEAQRAVLAACDLAANLSFANIRGAKHACFMRHLKQWRVALYGADAWPVLEMEFGEALSNFTMLSALTWRDAEGAPYCQRFGIADDPVALAQCIAFHATDAEHYDEDGRRWQWEHFVRWECPVAEEQGRCWPTSANLDAWLRLLHAQSLRYFYVSLNVSMPWDLSAYAARPYFDELEALVGDVNARAGASRMRATQAHTKWTAMRTEEVMVGSTKTGIVIAICVALGVLLLALRNWLTAWLAVVSICFIVLTCIGLQVLLGWKLGFMESICITVVVGFSVDFVAHVSIAYGESSGASSYARCEQAVGELGISCVSGAVSTMIACGVLTYCDMIPFAKFGLFMALNVLIALVVALGPFVALLCVFGPTGSTGSCVRPRLRDAILPADGGGSHPRRGGREELQPAPAADTPVRL